MTLLVYWNTQYAELARAIVAAGGFEAGEIERQIFPDGERYLRLITSPRARRVAIIGGTIDDAATLELFDLGCTTAKLGASSMTLVVPYFGYSTMERAVKPGEVVTAKCRARLLSLIPPSAEGNRVLFLDLHAEGIPHYLEGGIFSVHVYAKEIVKAAARRLGGDDFVLACTDAGRAKWVESLANDLGVTAAFVFKRRLDAERTEITAVSAYVKDKDVIIYDDMIRTGGSLINAARAYKDAGARSLAAIATHGLFPGDALEKIKASGLFKEIVTTDSHPRAKALAGGILTVESVAGLLAGALKEAA